MGIEENAKYINGLAKTFANISYDQTEELTEEDIVYSATTVISLFFMLEKERVVEKEYIKGQKRVNSNSKVNDELLEKVVEIIAKKDGKGYRIDEYYEENIPTIIASIRNKFAHGDYYIDTLTHEIIMNIEGKKATISIDKLIIAINEQIFAIIKSPKTNKLTRPILIPPKEYRRIENIEELKQTLEDITIRSYNIYKPSGNLTEEELNNYHITMKKISDNLSRGLDIYKPYNEGLDYFKKNKIRFKYDERHMTSKQLNDLAESFDDSEEFHNITVEDQLDVLMKTSMSICFPEETNLVLLSGINSLLIIFHYMFKQKQYALDKVIIPGDVSKITCDGAHMAIINLLACFNTVFLMQFDGEYGKKKSPDLGDRFDYGILDFDNIDPEIIDSKPKYHSDIKIKCKTTFENIKKKADILTEAYNNYMAVNDRDDEEASAKTYAIYTGIKENFNKLLPKYLKKKKEYLSSTKEYMGNIMYYNNVAIIEGIRNSICHGNVTVIMNDIYNPVFIFEDIYKEKTTFKLKIDFRTLQNMISESSEVIFNYFEYLLDKQNQQVLTKKY